MRHNTGPQKKNNGALVAMMILALCVVLSAVLLCSRLMAYSPADRRQSIPLTKSNGITRVTASRKPLAALPITGPLVLAAVPGFLTEAPGFTAYDKDTVWTGQTNVEIFSVKYNNESGETTVTSQDGVKVLAPGTGSVYEFALENTGNVALDYTLQMDAWFSDTEYPIPVVVSVTDYTGNFLVGSETESVDVLRLKEVRESGSVAAGYIQPYTLHWEWPFEQDDAYDTLLGNLAAEKDITLTIAIKTTASYSTDPEQPGGIPPKTGDTAQIALYAVLMVGSLAGILALLLLRRKEEGNEAP